MVECTSEYNKERNLLVCILAYDGLCTFEYGCAVKVFGLANPEFTNWYDLSIVTADKGEITGAGNVIVTADQDLSILQTADLIIIPGWRGTDALISEELREALIAANKRGARIASICCGIFVLAQCGFLNDLRATTHWRYVDDVKRLYPKIKIDRNVLYVDEGKILTSSGAAAGIDLFLHIVRTDFGDRIANQVARRLVIPAHREGGKTQYVSRPLAINAVNSIAPLLDHIRENLDKDWSIQTIAQEANVSPRTLQRRFKDATGHSPHTWLTIERVELAKELLKTTHLNIQQIATLTGLRTPETLRHHIKNYTKSSPTQFRSKFNPVKTVSGL
ncbi:MAG: transcriptional regulator FtrA [Robiginitomaculum sp.]